MEHEGKDVRGDAVQGRVEGCKGGRDVTSQHCQLLVLDGYQTQHDKCFGMRKQVKYLPSTLGGSLQAELIPDVSCIVRTSAFGDNERVHVLEA